MWANNINSIPRLIRADRKNNYALYQYISGRVIEPSIIDKNDINQAVAFLSKLKSLAAETGSERLPAASEAHFTVKEVVASLEGRLTALHAVKSNPYLESFLEKDFLPLYETVLNKTTAITSRSALALNEPLAKKARTLSPSDFGFHNAVKQINGIIYFLDFEYFGWDDPAKTIADFMLHPAMQLSTSLSNYFYEEALNIFNDSECLEQKVKVLYPLYALKWCLIILNEFLPERIARRQFAGNSSIDINKIQREQLHKAEQMLIKVVNADEQFPYPKQQS